MALVRTPQGTIGSSQGPQTLTIRFTSGVCWNGIDYGPRYRDEPVTMPANIARGFLSRGKAELYVRAPEPTVETPATLTEAAALGGHSTEQGNAVKRRARKADVPA